MKNSIDNPQDATAIRNEPCSETACATCFENRGCIYEQYLAAVTHNTEESHLESRRDTNPVISKRA